MSIKLGKYTHFKGNEYEVLMVALDSETLEEMVVYRDLNNEKKVWVRPLSMWNEVVEKDGRSVRRFTCID